MIHSPALNRFGFVDYREELNNLFLKVNKLDKPDDFIGGCFNAYDWILAVEKEMKSKGLKLSDKATYEYVLNKY